MIPYQARLKEPVRHAGRQFEAGDVVTADDLGLHHSRLRELVHSGRARWVGAVAETWPSEHNWNDADDADLAALQNPEPDPAKTDEADDESATEFLEPAAITAGGGYPSQPRRPVTDSSGVIRRPPGRPRRNAGG